MRVLLLSHTCLDPRQGRPKAEYLGRQAGVDLQVLVPDRWRAYGQWQEAAPADPAASYRLRVEKVRWPWSGPGQWYLHHYPGLERCLREFRPDLIDVWEEPWGLVSAQVCRLRNKLLPGTKVISETEQNIDKKLPPPFEWFRSYTLRQADFVIGRSRQAVDVLRGKGYRGPATTVPNAVDADLFRPMNPEACKAKLGLSSFAVGYAGRLVEEKGLLTLVAALAHCPPDVSLVLVGQGPLKPKLEAAAREIGRTAQVRFLDACPLEQLPEIFNALDVFVLPSLTTPRWKEQFGRVIIEAHACGVPVIGSDSGAIPEVVGDGGLIVPEDDARALAEAIVQMKNSPEFRRAAGARGRAQALACYTWERVAARMHRIYQHCLTSKGPWREEELIEEPRTQVA